MVRHVFGIRHLSPAGAVHLRRLLDDVRPTAVVVEGPAGAEQLLQALAHERTRPPIALLAFTRNKPVRSLSYPLAAYSPEFVAAKWAVQQGAELVFMDLPAETFLAMEEDDGAPPSEVEEESRESAPDESPLERLAREAGGTDLETWWERTFEHLSEPAEYLLATHAVGAALREVESPRGRRRNELREAQMRRVLRSVLARGHAPERVVAVCGAFHAPALVDALPPMTDEEFAALPRVEATVTLVPHSYARLHQRTGYGAGNHAPAYFEALHDELSKNRPERLGARFLSRVARTMRRSGLFRAPAQVIDALRLAHALAATTESPVVTLRDLRDAAVTCLGEGDARIVAEALDRVETGDAIGALPEGVSRTALQDDFRRTVVDLKLERYLRAEPQPLELDLREDRRATSEATAFLDRNRSLFLHRLTAGGVALARPVQSGQSLVSWKERWDVRWSEAFELALAEASLEGDTVSGLAAFRLSLRLAEATGAGDAASVLSIAARCGLADALEAARARVQAVAIEDDDLASVASAVGSLLEVVRFGGVRRIDPEPLWPLVEQLFVHAALLLPRAVLCADDARPRVREGLVTLARAVAEEPGRLPVERFDEAVRLVALGDVGDAFLAGTACAIALERQRLTDDELSAVVSRRLSRGTAPTDAGAFFEGLSSVNRMALFSRASLWESLSRYVDALSPDEFLLAVVPLRRTFSDYAPGETRRVVDQLAQAWAGGRAALAAAVEKPLAQEELAALEEKLADLGDLDL